MSRNDRGFTLIELMIVVVIIGILAGISIPNLLTLQDRARESAVKSNMHTIQLALEDFAVQTLGFYPDGAASTTPGGQTIQDLCPGNAYPENPFTGLETNVVWDGDPAAAGEMGINPAQTDQYLIKGFGKDGIFVMVLQEGM